MQLMAPGALHQVPAGHSLCQMYSCCFDTAALILLLLPF